MTKIEKFVATAKEWAIDPAHGYDQSNRWGPNVDCSSLPILLLEQCGIKVRSAGATYTGNMKSVFLRCGFEVVADANLATGSGLSPGDILLNEVNHAAIYVGNNQIVHASINEKGTTTGGQSGDQTGKEVCIRSYYNYPWDCALRYVDKDSNVPIKAITTSASIGDGVYTVKPGDSWWSIAASQLGSGAKMSELAAMNGKTTMSVIHPGDVIRVTPKAVGQSAAGIADAKKELEEKVKKLGGRVVWK